MSLLVAYRKEWMELIRTYRLLVVAVVLVVFGLTSPLIARLTPELISTLTPGTGVTIQMPPPTVKDAIGQYVKNMSQFGILLALLLSMGSIVQEKDKGTAAMMLVKPMPRGSFLAAKFAALADMFGICLLAAGLACYYYTLLLFEPMNILNWLVLNAMIFLDVLVYVALTIFCSTVTRSQAAAGGFALGMLVILGVAGTIPGLGKYLPGELISWGTRLMLGDRSASWAALGISLALIIVPLVAAWLLFEKQEL